MSRGNFRVAPFAVIFDGQSLNNYPAAPSNYPSVLMASHPTIPFNDDRDNVSIDGISWTVLATTVSRRLNPYAKGALINVLVMCGGSTDIWDNDSGATLYADHVSYANNAKAAGFDKVIATTLVGNWINSAPQNTARQDFNTLLLADASNAFDGVADLAGTAGLNDHTNATYYNAQLHWTAAGASLAASVVAPVLNTVLV